MKPYCRNLLFLFGMFVCGCAGASADDSKDYKPHIYGTVKTKFEISTYDGQMRFNVRNSRLGVRGNVSPALRYAMQIELSSEGKLEVLDSYVAVDLKHLSISLGQQQYGFSAELDCGGKNYFANRSFIGKFISQYYSTGLSDGRPVYDVNTIGSRDIGLLLSSGGGDFPLTVSLGIFNGEGINNPKWTRHVNFVSRIGYRINHRLRFAVGYYNGQTPVTSMVSEAEDGTLTLVGCKQKIEMENVEVFYTTRRFIVEAAYATRLLSGDMGRNRMHSVLVQSLYKIPIRRSKVFDHFAPMVRWDWVNDCKYIDEADSSFGAFRAHRITAGLTLGMTEKLLRGEIRLNYEHYMLGDRPLHMKANTLLHNKFTLEFIAVF